MTISIVIPTLNGGGTLARALEAIGAQRAPFPIELVAIDSGSTDGSLERLQAAGAIILQVPGDSFNHGGTRNAALEHASGALAVLMTQDAVPLGGSWLTALVQPLLEDDRVAGSFARQVPAPGASRLTIHALSRWVAAGTEPAVSGPLDTATFEAMSPAARHLTCAFDNVCACIRMSVWRQQPFKAVRIAEDLEWARDVMLRGYRIVFAPAAVVAHSHERGFRYELRRTYLVHQRLHQLFDVSTVPTLLSLGRSLASTLPVHVKIASKDESQPFRAMARAGSLAIAWPLGQYLGARAARTGREDPSVSGI